MELKLNRNKITGKNRTNTGAATKRKLLLGKPTAGQAVGTPDENINTVLPEKETTAPQTESPSFAKRLANTLSGAGKQYASSLGGAMTGLFSMGAHTREKANRQEQAEIERRLQVIDPRLRVVATVEHTFE